MSDDHHRTRPPQRTTAVADQLARTAWHTSSITRMVEEGRSCPGVLTQLAADRAAIDRAATIVLEDHVESCADAALPATVRRTQDGVA